MIGLAELAAGGLSCAVGRPWIGPTKGDQGATGIMIRRAAGIALLALALSFAARTPSGAAPRAHVYLFRGLADVFSTGMDTLAMELNQRGVYATSHSHNDWKSLADKAATDFKAGREGPIILIGHSLGADAVMEMADYLGDKGVPVALVMPFDGTQSFPVPGNVGRVVNFTQRDYAFMRPGAGFHGSLNNVDLRGDGDIGHLNIDKVPRLHARAINEVLAVVGGHGSPLAAKPVPRAAGSKDAAPHEGTARNDIAARNEDHSVSAPTGVDQAAPTPAVKPDAGAPVSVPPTADAPTGVAAPAAPLDLPQPRPAVRISPLQIPD
jgi:hypothetical protein